MNLKLKRTPGIYVVGFMASGKSTVGRLLAQRLGWSFFDIDEEIEAAEKTAIAEIFDTRGEAEFRRIEAAIIRRHVRRIEQRQPRRAGAGRRRVCRAGQPRPAGESTASPSGWIAPSRWSSAAWRWLRTGRWRAIPGSSPRSTRRGARPTPWPTCAFPLKATIRPAWSKPF